MKISEIQMICYKINNEFFLYWNNNRNIWQYISDSRTILRTEFCRKNNIDEVKFKKIERIAILIMSKKDEKFKRKALKL